MEGTTQLKGFGPISLIGNIYKILAKVLVGRLQKVLPSIISLLKGPVLVASECIHARYKDKLPGVLCMLDFEKAYDKVE